MREDAMQTRLLWIAISLLAAWQLADWLGAPPPSPADAGRSTQDWRDLEERVDALERAARAEAVDTVERVPADLVARIDRLESRADSPGRPPHSETPRMRDPKLVRKLNAAIARDDITAMQAIIAEGLDVDTRDDDRQTPLISAAIAGHIDLIDALRKHGADLERKGARGMTPLLAALDADQDEAALALIERGADMHAVDKNGEGALFWSARNDCRRVVAHLLAAGYPVDFRNHRGTTPLMAAAGKGRIENATKLLDAGADVNAKDKRGGTALSRALERGHDAVVELLRARGAH